MIAQHDTSYYHLEYNEFMVLLQFPSQAQTWQVDQKAEEMIQHHHRFSCVQILFPVQINRICLLNGGEINCISGSQVLLDMFY
jgi:hypothetical protein